jgi:hypothetical protein
MPLRTRRRNAFIKDENALSLDRSFTLNSTVGYGPRANRREDVSLIEVASKAPGITRKDHPLRGT